MCVLVASSISLSLALARSLTRCCCHRTLMTMYTVCLGLSRCVSCFFGEMWAASLLPALLSNTYIPLMFLRANEFPWLKHTVLVFCLLLIFSCRLRLRVWCMFCFVVYAFESLSRCYFLLNCAFSSSAPFSFLSLSSLYHLSCAVCSFSLIRLSHSQVRWSCCRSHSL